MIYIFEGEPRGEDLEGDTVEAETETTGQGYKCRLLPVAGAGLPISGYPVGLHLKALYPEGFEPVFA